MRATDLEGRLWGVLGGRAGGSSDEKSRKRYASHCVRRTVTGREKVVVMRKERERCEFR